jgi:hypothetical protein
MVLVRAVWKVDDVAGNQVQQVSAENLLEGGLGPGRYYWQAKVPSVERQRGREAERQRGREVER